MISVYLFGKRKPGAIALVPGCFYMFVVSSYLLNAKIGFGFDWPVAYIVAGLLTIGYGVLVVRAGLERRQLIESSWLYPMRYETPDNSKLRSQRLRYVSMSEEDGEFDPA